MLKQQILLVLLVLMSVTSAETKQPDQAIRVLGIVGAIGPATSDYIVRGIEAASQESASLVVITINTPGGLDTAMRDIITAIIDSPVPVVTFVSPGGARAASAGTYISYASHVAAMAPGTNIGASTPVQLAGPALPAPEDPDGETTTGGSAMEKKMVNDAAAYLRSLAELRGRNADWAELTVRDGASLSANEALSLQVVDLIASDLADLLKQIDGLVIAMPDGEQTLDTAGRSVVFDDPDWRTELLAILTNPNIVLVLGMIGLYGIILEFYNPGALVPGIVGVICLVLAGYAMQLLPVDYAGAALILIGLTLMVAEAMVPSFGMMGIGGVVAFCIGGLMLFDTDVEAFQVGWPVLGATGVVAALLIFATVSIAMKLRSKKVTTGIETIVGVVGQVLTNPEEPLQVRVGAEIWAADATEPLQPGDQVVVLGVDGLHLTVGKKPTSTS